MDLKDKWALVTGGTSGMGSAVALAMADKGASVMIESRHGRRQALP
jgi:NAD(P)-dependent dehydrogenase (short-subunit alcohol dehydrogenase family)